MRPAKLYLEIFTSFVLAIIVSETMIFFLFTDSERRLIGYKLEQDTILKVRMLKELVDEKDRWMTTTDLPQNQEVQTLIMAVQVLYNARIWISNVDGTVLVNPSHVPPPPQVRLLNRSGYVDEVNGIRLYNDVRNSQQVFASIPLAPHMNRKPILYLAFNTGMPPHRQWQFVLGLAVIGLVVAFLIIPVSKFITDRIQDLKVSALRIAEGELSHRVSVSTKDEIGELGLAFNQMADRLERMIVGGKELTANISHELRTPLTRIRIAQEMLTERLQKGDPTKCVRHLDGIREDIEELDTLIGRILELSKLDIHEVSLKREAFSLSPLLEELLEKLGPVITRKQLTVEKNLLSVPVVMGDRNALYSAFLNLVENAAKYSPEHGVIRIDSAQDEAFFSITVINTSDPLPTEDLERIFEPFYRPEGSRESGTGLGLSIAAKIIQKHGGTIRASNTQDGMALRVKLPVGRRTAAAAGR